jgi:uncharacterized LabA/DUF88 family protein
MSSHENVSMALFCDFENVALGVRDANYEKFDIRPILERLLLKGSIVIKKAYCDWDRYKGFKASMHEANFELIEIPHVRQSGKNSADIRLVVDALDLCYTKSHVDTFVIISGDSDFSPLVSKLRENAKHVIGVGVKQSTSDLLIANCDEFIFYDDLVRESQRTAARRDTREAQPNVRRSPEDDRRRKDELEARKSKALEIAAETFEALMSERGDSGKIWASVLKEAIKRRKPDFNESYYGFRAFGNLLEEAQARGLMEFGRDDKSGTYVYRVSGAEGAPAGSTASSASSASTASSAFDPNAPERTIPSPSSRPSAQERNAAGPSSRRGGRRGSRQGPATQVAPQPDVNRADDALFVDAASADEAPLNDTHPTYDRFEPHQDTEPAQENLPLTVPEQPATPAARRRTPRGRTAKTAQPAASTAPVAPTPEPDADSTDTPAPRRGRGRQPRQASLPAEPVFEAVAQAEAAQQEAPSVAADDGAPPAARKSAPRKPAARSRRPRKPAAAGDES